ncbi:ATP-binding protein [Oligoflexus tunisiensis]|uniref:ATP-binding protein n=1 Tax=Oligoflexus tunisiensis TaxID=708132 RepID=UPI000B119C51|nr:ATP-binding protein [Oligoflexus tunisiensis]
MLDFLSQHFLAVLVTLSVALLLLLQVWQFHQRALKKQKASYEKILNTMLDGFIVQQADGTVVGFNIAAHRILGMTEDELLGRRTLDPRWQTVYEDGSNIPGESLPAMITLATGQIIQNMIMGVCWPNGEKRWLSVNSAPLFEQDEAKPKHVVTTFQDITESRRLAEQARHAQERLELALQAGKVGIWEWNVDTGHVFRDDQLHAIYGQTLAPDFASWVATIHPDDRTSITEGLQRIIENGKAMDARFRVLHPDGSIRHMRAIARLVQDSASRTRIVTGVNWDATEQVEREERLQEAKEKAEEASRAKSDFLANMSHEIRTPLNGIFGMLSLLKNSQLSQAQMEMLHTVESCSEGLLTVLNDVLDLSRIESRRLQVELVPFDIQHSAQEVVKLLLPQAAQKNLPLNIDSRPDLPRMVIGDAARFKQILLNLLSNAIKFTERGEVRLSLGGQAQGHECFHFVIEVKDTGIGISQENQHKLFQAFSQADSSISRRFGGTGLGLTISASLAELMGGRLEMESEPGRGSTFRLQLPLNIARDKRLQSAVGDVITRVRNVDPGRRILVVEDNKINQIVVTSLLQILGYTEVDVAEDGLMALQQLELRDYHLIFMDMQMPGMDGLTATRRIRERVKHRHLVIVAMTANAFEEDRRRCLDAGMDEFLAKPFTRKDLERILEQFAERQAS